MAYILIAEDDASIRTVLHQALTRLGHHIDITPNISQIFEWVCDGKGEILLTDVTLKDGNALEYLKEFRNLRPKMPIIVMSANSTFLTAIRANDSGAFEYLPKPFDLNVLIETINKALNVTFTVRSSDDFEEAMPLIGRSVAMQNVYRTIARLTKTTLSVLITGESGTGKERVARALHDYSLRKHAPFVAINMAAIPKDLIESELFGHERGAFTGALTRKIGRFEQADGGTLFLDEIGDMPIEAQTRLLRVLQESEFTTIGGKEPIKTNVRIVAASNKDLQSLVFAKAFREDLFYRLCVVPIHLPPLRDRVEDIPNLTYHFLKLAQEEGIELKHFNDLALQKMQSYNWPGNVRELENFVRRVCVLYAQDVITETEIEESLHNKSQTYPNIIKSDADLVQKIEFAITEICKQKLRNTINNLYDDILPIFERPILNIVLEHTQGNQVKAAQILGINRNTLYKKITCLDLKRSSQKER